MPHGRWPSHPCASRERAVLRSCCAARCPPALGPPLSLLGPCVPLCREAFNQATLYATYEKRTEKIKPDRAEYVAAKVGSAGLCLWTLLQLWQPGCLGSAARMPLHRRWRRCLRQARLPHTLPAPPCAAQVPSPSSILAPLPWFLWVVAPSNPVAPSSPATDPPLAMPAHRSIPVCRPASIHSQAADPEFYRTADSLKYGAHGKVPEANIDRMVAELNER